MTTPPPAPPLPPGWWGDGGPPAASPALPGLLAAGTLDAELAALAWLLQDAGVPLLVAGPAASGRTTVLTALLDLLPPLAAPLPVEPDGAALGRLPDGAGLARPGTGAADAGAVPRLVLLAADLTGGPGALAPATALAVVRAAAAGHGLAATAEGDRLEAVLEHLRGVPVRASEDETAALGLVLVLGERSPGTAPRVSSAHYLRPVARDVHGHVQRRPPAVLAARDRATGSLEHFAWGIVDELGGRTGRRPVEFERVQALRAGRLRALAAAGAGAADVRALAAEVADPG